MQDTPYDKRTWTTASTKSSWHLGVYLSSRQQVVAEEDTQRTSYFEVIVSGENPMELLRDVLEDVVLILSRTQQRGGGVARRHVLDRPMY